MKNISKQFRKNIPSVLLIIAALLMLLAGINHYIESQYEGDIPLLKTNETIIATPGERTSVSYISTPRQLDITSSALIVLVNAERGKAGIAPVIELNHLSAGAWIRAKTLFTSGQWSHAGYVQAIDNVLWDHSHRYIGEDLGRGFTGGEQYVISAWMKSASHKAIMLDPHFKYAGTAHYENYWVLWMSSNP